MENYVRFFESEGSSFLMESIYVNVYDDMGCISFRDKNRVTILLEAKCVEVCKKKGLEMLNNLEKFYEYFSLFSKFLEKCYEECQCFVEECDAFGLVYECIRFLNFYRWTESFYTDAAYKALSFDNTGILKENIKALERIKYEGRLFLNAFFNGKDSYIQKMSHRCGKNNWLLSTTVTELRNDWKVCEKDSKLRNNSHILSAGDTLRSLETSEFLEIQQWLQGAVEKNVRGIGAAKGVVTGECYILTADFTNYDILQTLINKMPEGSILVSETTSPDIILACYKAKGIITNQGGLGSHAAIVSREMGIPCIVGTQNATHILKNGSRITMNGMTGEVILIEK